MPVSILRSDFVLRLTYFRSNDFQYAELKRGQVGHYCAQRANVATPGLCDSRKACDGCSRDEVAVRASLIPATRSARRLAGHFPFAPTRWRRDAVAEHVRPVSNRTEPVGGGYCVRYEMTVARSDDDGVGDAAAGPPLFLPRRAFSSALSCRRRLRSSRRLRKTAAGLAAAVRSPVAHPAQRCTGVSRRLVVGAVSTVAHADSHRSTPCLSGLGRVSDGLRRAFVSRCVGPFLPSFFFLTLQDGCV